MAQFVRNYPQKGNILGKPINLAFPDYHDLATFLFLRIALDQNKIGSYFRIRSDAAI